jgi:hypothetical protein
MFKKLGKASSVEPGEGVPVVCIGDDGEGEVPALQFSEGLAGSGINKISL